jgi:hypothetical protein
MVQLLRKGADLQDVRKLFRDVNQLDRILPDVLEVHNSRKWAATFCRESQIWDVLKGIDYLTY